MAEHVYQVLFLSRRNSARSIMAEALLNRDGGGRFRAFSAAVDPAPAVDPRVIELAAAVGLPLGDVRPKHYSEFAGANAAGLDFVFTLSDTAAGEALPEWPGMPVTAHWSTPDPILAEGADWEKRRAFASVLSELERRLRIFAVLPFASLDRMSLKARIAEIGEKAPA